MCDNYSVRRRLQEVWFDFWFWKEPLVPTFNQFFIWGNFESSCENEFWIYKNSNSTNFPIQFNTIYNQV
jgi:hypothetical protein